jgi:hypothetical protein
MKKCSKLLMIKEMQNKTTMRYHPTHVSIISESKTNKGWKGCGEKENSCHCLWECKLVQPLWKIVWRFLKKLKIKLPYDPAIPLLSIYPKEMKAICQRDTCYVDCSTIQNSQESEST